MNAFSMKANELLYVQCAQCFSYPAVDSDLRPIFLCMIVEEGFLRSSAPKKVYGGNSLIFFEALKWETFLDSGSEDRKHSIFKEFLNPRRIPLSSKNRDLRRTSVFSIFGTENQKASYFELRSLRSNKKHISYMRSSSSKMKEPCTFGPE